MAMEWRREEAVPDEDRWRGLPVVVPVKRAAAIIGVSEARLRARFREDPLLKRRVCAKFVGGHLLVVVVKLREWFEGD